MQDRGNNCADDILDCFFHLDSQKFVKTFQAVQKKRTFSPNAL